MAAHKYICPDCKKNLGKSVTKDATPCKTCGKRICNFCHVAQGQLCRSCKRNGTAPVQISARKAPPKKKRFLFF